MAASGRALRFNRTDGRMGMDSVLADDSGGDPNCDCVACKVPEGATIIVDSTKGMAFLDGLCGNRVASGVAIRLVLLEQDFGEAVIEERFSETFARSQPDWRDQLVFERGLLAGRQTGDVLSRVPAILFARPGIDRSLAEQQCVDVADDHSGRYICVA